MMEADVRRQNARKMMEADGRGKNAGDCPE